MNTTITLPKGRAALTKTADRSVAGTIINMMNTAHTITQMTVKTRNGRGGFSSRFRRWC